MSDFNRLFDEIIARLGGREKLAQRLDVGLPALSNYRARQHFPAHSLKRIEAALAEIGWHIDHQRLQLYSTVGRQKRIVMIITGGIAAYKALEVARRLMDRSYLVRIILTKGAEQFITPLSAAALTGEKVYTELFSLTDEAEMGHIRLAREADLLLVVPATAHFIAKLAHGLADDLASTVCLATEAPVMIAPAMNPVMWSHPATRENLACLIGRGADVITPETGDTACGEVGEGRLAEPMRIVECADNTLSSARPLAGKHILITSGPTYEPIDPVRFIGNRSSGKQGHALAEAAAASGAQVTLVTGPVALQDPVGVKVVPVETAAQMHQACMEHLPADIVICAAAVADWHVRNAGIHKTKKTSDGPPQIQLAENLDILHSISTASPRPKLVIGFAAETENLDQFAQEKLNRKGCDWIIANHISTTDGQNVFGADENTVSFVTADHIEHWPPATKRDIAANIMDRITEKILSS